MQTANMLELYETKRDRVAFTDILFTQGEELSRLLLIRVFHIFEPDRWAICEQLD